MQKRIIIVFILFGVLPLTYTQTSFDVLHSLKQQSLQYETGINWGHGLSVLGASIAPIGFGLASTGLALGQLNITNEQETNTLTTAGYALTGIGVFSLIVGMIVWRHQEKKYIAVINRQYKYRNFISK